MTTFWEKAAHSVYRVIFLLCLFVVLVISYLGFKGGNLVLIASVPGHCFPFSINKCVSKVYEYMSIIKRGTKRDDIWNDFVLINM